MGSGRFYWVLVAASCAVGASVGEGADSTLPPAITSISKSGVGYVQFQSTNGVVNAQIGRWDTPYPNPDTGEPAPELEPYGQSVLTIDVDVNGGGKASFNFGLLTYDAGIFDWYDITLLTPYGEVPIVSNLGKPGTAYGSYWVSPPIAQSIDLDPYKGQHVQFVFSVQQDGWGDQTQGTLGNFTVADPCPIPDLTTLSDPLTVDFELQNGNVFDLAHAVPGLTTAFQCVSGEIRHHGGTPVPSSAYRPPLYQAHLLEVFLRSIQHQKDMSEACRARREKVEAEMTKHAIITRPAGVDGPHTRGIALDMNWGPNKWNSFLPDRELIDAAAQVCNLRRRLSRDPIHFELF